MSEEREPTGFVTAHGDRTMLLSDGPSPLASLHEPPAHLSRVMVIVYARMPAEALNGRVEAGGKAQEPKEVAAAGRDRQSRITLEKIKGMDFPPITLTLPRTILPTTMTRPAPPSPLYTLRPAHACTITHLSFSLPSGRLLSADSEGWITVWELDGWRVETVWSAHPNRTNDGTGKAVGGALWVEAVGRDEKGRDLVLSQGRDHRLVLSALPLRPSTTLSRAPTAPSLLRPSEVEVLAESPTNALSFCKAAGTKKGKDVWVAAPSSVGEEYIDIFSVSTPDASSSTPSKITRIHRAVGKDAFADKTGALMALSLFSSPTDPSSDAEDVLLLAGYEDGRIAVFRHSNSVSPSPSAAPSSPGGWSLIWTGTVHREPTMSVTWGVGTLAGKGEEKEREEGKEAGWAVGWSAGADHRIGRFDVDGPGSAKGKEKASSGDAVEAEIGSRAATLSASTSSVEVTCTVHKTLHPGSATIAARSDGKVLATAGWDGRIRLYDARSDKGLRELGALEVRSGKAEGDQGDGQTSGVGAVAFAPLSSSSGTGKVSGEDSDEEESIEGRAFLAAAGKDGRVVIWEVYPP